MDFLKLTHDILSVDDILKLVSSEKCGAVSIFVGTTRDNFDGKEVKSLEYEAYESMALKVMKSMCETIRNKWKDVHNIAIYHRLGLVPVLEASVVIAISSPHRVESQAAVKYCIENLKVNELMNEKKAEKLSNDFQPHAVQINASCSEMKNRIQKYTDRKREQINMSNIQDFIINRGTADGISEDKASTCARVDAVLVKSKDSKGHLKVLRTENIWGPQTKVDFDSPTKIVKSSSHDLPSTSGIEERILDVENHLNIIRPISSDVYSRLKKIEDKILELESISPEYALFWSRKSQSNAGSCDLESESSARKRMKFTSDDIWKKMKKLTEN
ncbi:molybdenum cofactor synthesis 2B [Arctopsyche grandis]|uniref:molybdenum cofactor synthesis 2B n=1 Tax=Arctopsyche grandis TaxID=121162 RepID=UPI00406D7D79